MPLQSPPKTIVVVGPEHPQGLRWREAMRERGALLAHTERVPQALDWLSRLAPDWLISVTPLPAPPHCRQLTWSGTQEELESLLHDIAPPPSASETLVLGELEIDPQQGRLSVQGRGSVHLPATEFRLLHCLLRHAHAQVVKIDGSSTVFPITEGVAEDFQKSKKNAVKVTVGISGTGGGFKKFCRGETDISNASRPILAKEMADCKAAGVEYYELPVAFDALTVVINPKNAFIKQLTVAELKAMWEPAAQGKVLRWNQVNPAWPDAPIKLFGAGADSAAPSTTSPKPSSARPRAAAATSPPRKTTTCWCRGISSDVNAIGYFGYAYYAENQGKLKAVPIVNPKGRRSARAWKQCWPAPTSPWPARSSST
jgi:phosphate binding protein